MKLKELFPDVSLPTVVVFVVFCICCGAWTTFAWQSGILGGLLGFYGAFRKDDGRESERNRKKQREWTQQS